MEKFVIDTANLRDLRSEVLDSDGRIKVLPASFWASTTLGERAALGVRIGAYSFPTVELVEHLKRLVGDRSAIEIGSGNGVLADALGIPATDSKQQDRPDVKLWYKLHGQPTIPYGPNVIEMHASRAVRHYKPDVVIGCWITHKWDDRHPELEGNAWGVDQADVLRHCKLYVKIGNEYVHAKDPIWKRPHTIEYPDWLYSRAAQEAPNWIATWTGTAGQPNRR